MNEHQRRDYNAKAASQNAKAERWPTFFKGFIYKVRVDWNILLSFPFL